MPIKCHSAAARRYVPVFPAEVLKTPDDEPAVCPLHRASNVVLRKVIIIVMNFNGLLLKVQSANVRVKCSVVLREGDGWGFMLPSAPRLSPNEQSLMTTKRSGRVGHHGFPSFFIHFCYTLALSLSFFPPERERRF